MLDAVLPGWEQSLQIFDAANLRKCIFDLSKNAATAYHLG